MPVFVGRRITVEKQSDLTRPYACANCGYRTEVQMVATAHGQADGSIVMPKRQIEVEAEERADAALADEVQVMLDLVPCPRCGARSDDAALYRQNTALALIGWIFAGVAMGFVTSLPATVDRRISGSPILGLIFWTTAGVALAGATWYRRNQRIARAARLLPKDDMAMAKDLLPRHDGGTAEGKARQLLWAMSNVLPWGAPHPRAGSYVFRTAEDMAKVWAEHGGEPGKLPTVEFAQHMVLAVFEAEGSYREVRHVQRVLQGKGKLWIVIGKASRPWPMKNPASVIAVPRADGEPVFLEAASNEAQDLLSGAEQ
jgi:hypothetical protein